LGELGFETYSAFMASALGAELAARDRSLARALDPTIRRFEDLRAAAHVLLSQAGTISAAYIGSENVPFNFRVLAAQLGQDGAAIGVISANYTLLSAEMKNSLDAFIAAARDVSQAINDGYFLSCTARVQREMLERFASEHASDEAARAREMQLLDRQQREYGARAIAGLQGIAREAKHFHQACTEMARLAAGLEVTRIMGKVECSRHARVKDRLDELLCDLDVFQKTVAAALREIEVKNQAIQQQTGALLANAAA
jgi:aerotaxis receptor